MNLHPGTIRTAGVAIAIFGIALPSLACAAPYKTKRGNAASTLERQVEQKEYVSIRHAIFLRGQSYFGKAGNFDKAAKLWQEAAKMCDADAQSSLGYLYYIGIGVRQSYRQAAKWYHRAAEAGSSDAQYSLASMYYRGQGVPKSMVQSMAWFRIALANGNSSASEELRFIEKHATAKQISEAKWFTKKIHSTSQQKSCTDAPDLKSADDILAANIQ